MVGSKVNRGTTMVSSNVARIFAKVGLVSNEKSSMVRGIVNRNRPVCGIICPARLDKRSD